MSGVIPGEEGSPCPVRKPRSLAKIFPQKLCGARDWRVASECALKTDGPQADAAETCAQFDGQVPDDAEDDEGGAEDGCEKGAEDEG